MSAFLFTVSMKFIKAQTTEKLEKIVAEYKEVVDKFDWSKFQMCDFESDQASGYKASIEMIEQELIQRKAGINKPLDRVLVLGYNPKEETD